MIRNNKTSISDDSWGNGPNGVVQVIKAGSELTQCSSCVLRCDPKCCMNKWYLR